MTTKPEARKKRIKHWIRDPDGSSSRTSESLNALWRLYAEARAYAEERQKNHDAKFYGQLVLVWHTDGSILFWAWARLERYKRLILIVYTEHHGHFVYPAEDTVGVRAFPMSSTKSLGDLVSRRFRSAAHVGLNRPKRRRDPRRTK
jgi:hypothetical protein